MARKCNVTIREASDIRKRIILILSLVLLFNIQMDAENKIDNDQSKVQFVYVSNSTYAKCYHLNQNCISLNHSKKISKIPITEAKKTKRPCKNCCWQTKSIQFQKKTTNSKRKKKTPPRNPLKTPLDSGN
jgi:hypothetical protein